MELFWTVTTQLMVAFLQFVKLNSTETTLIWHLRLIITWPGSRKINSTKQVGSYFECSTWSGFPGCSVFLLRFYQVALASASLFGMFFRYRYCYLCVVVWLSNITPGGSEAKVVGRNTRRKRHNKKNFKNHIIGDIITSKDFLSVKIRKF